MLTIIFGFLTSFISGVAQPLAGAYEKSKDVDQAKYQSTVDLSKAEIAAGTSVIIADEQHWYTAMVRPLFALPFIIYNFKLVLWDKVLSMGATDPLSPDLLKIEMIIIGAYFVGISVDKFAKVRRS